MPASTPNLEISVLSPLIPEDDPPKVPSVTMPSTTCRSEGYHHPFRVTPAPDKISPSTPGPLPLSDSANIIFLVAYPGIHTVIRPLVPPQVPPSRQGPTSVGRERCAAGVSVLAFRRKLGLLTPMPWLVVTSPLHAAARRPCASACGITIAPKLPHSAPKPKPNTNKTMISICKCNLYPSIGRKKPR